MTCDATPREFFDSGDHEAAAAALRTLDAIAEALMAAAPDEFPSAGRRRPRALPRVMITAAPAGDQHVENSLRYLFALYPRLRLLCRYALRIICAITRMRGPRKGSTTCARRGPIGGGASFGWRSSAPTAAAARRHQGPRGLLDDEDDEVRGGGDRVSGA